MTKKSRTAITPTRQDDYPEWYQQVIKNADLAENAPVRGCMVIKPWGYGIWENIQRVLDQKFKETGHQNAYFPLFIPKSYIEKEAQHVDGFAKECAVVTHSRLESDGEGGLQPRGALEEPLIVRPTSETIIGEMYAKWVDSYRDLPILINQWANVVRWEMRTRLFLRTTEFLWQEGHTAHASAPEAQEETQQMFALYRDFAEKYMAMPVICGEKTEGERFPGAINTFSIEAMMQDRKALQAGTAHFLGQNFARSCGILFNDANGERQHAWTTSWGVSTRLVGGLIMTHGDDNGLVLPPRLAPTQVVILPIIPKESARESVLQACHQLKRKLQDTSFDGSPLKVEIDKRELRGGEKRWQWIKKGIPITLEIGPRDLQSDTALVGRREQEADQRQSFPTTEIVEKVATWLWEIQNHLYQKALYFQKSHTVSLDTKEAFYNFFTAKNPKKPEIHGGFALAHWNGSAEIEDKIKKDLKVTIRCIPTGVEKEKGTCPFSGEKSTQRVLFAKAY